MTATSVRKPNGFLLALGTLITGAAGASWFILLHFLVKWWKNGPNAPEGDYIYAHVQHGGATYFNAMQSTASHLVYPVFACGVFGGVIAALAYGRNMFGRKPEVRPYWSLFAYQVVGALIAIAVIYFYGHDILNALIDSPVGPASDDLGNVIYH